MADRCTVTDLEPDMCAHCRKLPDPFAEPRSTRTADTGVGPAFRARYPGKCTCGTDFYPNDAIRADGTGGYLGPCCHDLIGEPS